MTEYQSPLRLKLSKSALQSNWRWLAEMSGSASTGAAVKANAYGLGAPEVVRHLQEVGCRDFFVATWVEAQEVAPHLAKDSNLSVFHGVSEADMPAALALDARPVLSTPEQVARWHSTGRPCDVMIDTGMNRLGLSVSDCAAGILDALVIDTVMSHLVGADEDVAMNQRQQKAFALLAGVTNAKRMSLANSAGICLGAAYHFDLTRPGLSLYGGVQRAEAAGHIKPVFQREARIIQRRRLDVGDTIGYNALWVAPSTTEVAIVNLGYADGYFRGFTNKGLARVGDKMLPVIGRVSMDLTALDINAAPDLKESDWVSFDDDLPAAAAASGMSQYELLTSLGRRYDRIWY